MKSFRLNDSIGPLVTLAVGILMLINPLSASRVLIVIGGVLLLISGLYSLLLAIKSHAGARDPALPGALIQIALGVFMAFSPYTVMKMAGVIIGVYLLLDGLIGLSAEANPLARIMHVLLMVGGILLLVNPWSAVMTVIQWAGIGLLADGAVGLATGSSLINR